MRTRDQQQRVYSAPAYWPHRPSHGRPTCGLVICSAPSLLQIPIQLKLVESDVSSMEEPPTLYVSCSSVLSLLHPVPQLLLPGMRFVSLPGRAWCLLRASPAAVAVPSAAHQLPAHHDAGSAAPAAPAAAPRRADALVRGGEAAAQVVSGRHFAAAVCFRGAAGAAVVSGVLLAAATRSGRLDVEQIAWRFEGWPGLTVA